jgi:hypothetical protein
MLIDSAVILAEPLVIAASLLAESSNILQSGAASAADPVMEISGPDVPSV